MDLFYSLSMEAFGDGAEFPPPVLDQVGFLADHVIELLAFLRDHHIGVPLHPQLQTYNNNTGSGHLSAKLANHHRGAKEKTVYHPHS